MTIVFILKKKLSYRQIMFLFAKQILWRPLLVDNQYLPELQYNKLLRTKYRHLHVPHLIKDWRISLQMNSFNLNKTLTKIYILWRPRLINELHLTRGLKKYAKAFYYKDPVLVNRWWLDHAPYQSKDWQISWENDKFQSERKKSHLHRKFIPEPISSREI